MKSTKYKIGDDHTAPSKAVSDAIDDPHAATAWEVVLVEKGKPAEILKRFPADQRSRAQASAAGARDGTDDPKVRVFVRPVVDVFEDIAARQAIVRAKKGGPSKGAHYWSVAYHESLLNLEAQADSAGLFVTMEEELGDAAGRLPRKIPVSVSAQLTVKHGRNLAEQIVRVLRDRVDALERAYRQAGLMDAEHGSRRAGKESESDVA